MLNEYPVHLDEKVKESYSIESKYALENSAVNVIFNVSDDDDYSKGYTTMEGGTGVDFLGESANLNDVENEEGYKAVGVAKPLGGKIKITYVEMLNQKDPTTLFNKVISGRITTMVSDTANFVETQAMKMLNDGFTTFLAPDAVTVFGTHTYKSTAAQFINKSPTSIASGTAALEELEEYSGGFTDANGKPMPMNMKTLYVKQGGKASREFKKVLAKDVKLQATTVGSVNIYNNGDYTLVESPFITSGDAWYAKDSSKENALILDFIERPTLKTRVTRENLDEVTPQAGAIRTICKDLPISWYGSLGA